MTHKNCGCERALWVWPTKQCQLGIEGLPAVTAYVMCVLHFDRNRAHASTHLISDEMMLTHMHLNDCFERTLPGWNIQKCKCDAWYINNKNNDHCPLPDMETCDACMSACCVRQIYFVTTVLTSEAGCHSQVLDHPLLYTAACINQAAILQQACNTASCKALCNTLIDTHHKSTAKFQHHCSHAMLLTSTSVLHVNDKT